MISGPKKRLKHNRKRKRVIVIESPDEQND